MALKTLKAKVPAGLNSIARLMEMDVAEIQAWPHFNEMQSAMKDYNLNAIGKEQLIGRLEEISIKCAEAQIYHYSTGIDKVISAIRVAY